MAMVEKFDLLFSLGKFEQCNHLIEKNTTKGDNLQNQWIVSCNLISSQFMSVRAPLNIAQLQLELSALYNLCFIRVQTENVGFLYDDQFLQIIKETLIRVIGQQDWRHCNLHQDTTELLFLALQQVYDDQILSPLVSVCCLWTVVNCRQTKTDSVMQLVDKCLTLHLKNLELPPITLLPLSLILTGQHYIDTPSVTDIVYMTAGMAYYRKDHQKAKEYLNQVQLPEFKGYTAYLIACQDYYSENYVEVLTTLAIDHTDMTSRLKALHCHLFGLALSKLEKHHCAIQKFREALEHDFSFLLPLYHLSLEYRSLGMTLAELESLNLLSTALQNADIKQTDYSQDLFTQITHETNGELTWCQVRRCISKRYLDLLVYLNDVSTIQISGNSLVTVPRIQSIYLEAIHCLHEAKNYNDCVAVCDQVLSCLPSGSQNSSFSFHNQSEIDQMSCDTSLTGIVNISDIEPDRLESASSQEGSKRKRLNSEESKTRETGCDSDVLVLLYKADCFVFLEKIETALQCLDKCIDKIPFSVDLLKGTRAQQQNKRRRLDSCGDDSSQFKDTESVNDLQKLASSVYCHLGVAVATKGRNKDALHFLRIGLRLDPGNLDALYNHAVLLWSDNKRDASVDWCQGRDIETVSDSFHLSGLLRQKQNKLRSLTGKDSFHEKEMTLCNTITGEHLLKLDVLCLNYLLTGHK
ncbi:FANCG [Mytilus coruscus]|uniref:FANCG n=1 Tax=Mytilus coruscus TaxID=42192 RepID=A0A6J8EXM0_MYTCO|nr:FANCG [Mytilus coruscus]